MFFAINNHIFSEMLLTVKSDSYNDVLILSSVSFVE